MPLYTFKCEDTNGDEDTGCGKKFTIHQSMSFFSGETVCPWCGGMAQHCFMDDAKTVRSTVTENDDQITIGRLAKRNDERLSSDEKAHITHEHNKYKYEDSTKKLPKGMSRMGKPKDRQFTKKQRKKDPKRRKNE